VKITDDQNNPRNKFKIRKVEKLHVVGSVTVGSHNRFMDHWRITGICFLILNFSLLGNIKAPKLFILINNK